MITILVYSCEESASLTRPFSLDEVDRVVADRDGNKSFGPDGLNFSFIRLSGTCCVQR